MVLLCRQTPSLPHFHQQWEVSRETTKPSWLLTLQIQPQVPVGLLKMLLTPYMLIPANLLSGSLRQWVSLASFLKSPNTQLSDLSLHLLGKQADRKRPPPRTSLLLAQSCCPSTLQGKASPPVL